MKLNLFTKSIKTPEEKAALKKDRVYLILSGVLFALGFPPVPLPITLFVALIPLLIVIERRKTFAEVTRAVYFMSFIASLIALYWVGGYTQAKDPFLMIGGFLLFFINPIAFCIPTTIYYMGRGHVARKRLLFLFPFFWVLYEVLYTLTDWSFPWLNIGNGMSNFTTFIQFADIFGIYGLSLVVVYINVFLFLGLRTYQKKKQVFNVYVILACVFLIVPLIYGAVKLEEANKQNDTIKVGVVQPNLDPYDKWAEKAIDPVLDIYVDESHKLYKQNIDLLLWPETALPIYLLDPVYRNIYESVRKLVDSSGVPLLTGMPDLRYYTKAEKKPHDVKYSKISDLYYATYNAIYVMNPHGTLPQRYGKMKLVPFGERVPFVDQIPLLGDLMRWGVGLSGWNVGEELTVFSVKVPSRADSVHIGGVICYESIYPEPVRHLAASGAECIVVVTNDSWYGNTSGPYQHRDYAKIRAVENRRNIVRAANGGISCIIDSYGRIMSQTKMYERTTYTGNVNLSHESTFYMKYPDIIIGLSVFLCGLLIAWISILGTYVIKTFPKKFKKVVDEAV